MMSTALCVLVVATHVRMFPEMRLHASGIARTVEHASFAQSVMFSYQMVLGVASFV